MIILSTGKVERWVRSIEDRTVLVIGGAGFIGSHIVEALRPRNTVRIFDNFSRVGRAGSAAVEGCEVIRGDVRDASALVKASKEADLVLHLAAIAGIHTVTKHPLTTMEVNLMGAYNAMQAASEAGVERFVFCSSSEVYGPRVYLGKENDITAQGPVVEPRWGYAVSKLAGDFLAHSFYLEKGLKTTSVRFFNVYGPRQVGEGAVHRFVTSALKGEPIQIFGSGLQIRAWTYVDDAVNGALQASGRPEAVGKVYNIGNPATACTLIALANKVVELSGSRSNLEFVPLGLTDVELRVPDIGLARQDLGFEPTVDLGEGLRRTIAYYRGSLDAGT